MPRNQSLVTGGVRGIGRSIVQELQKRGDSVAVFDCLPVDCSDVGSLIASGVEYISVDISSAQAVKNAFELLSFKHIDILVNNAGITRDTLALRMSESDWDSVLAVNLKGAFLCAQQALKYMIKQPKGYIVSISSIVGLRGNAGQANYAASKGGIIALTKTLAVEYASRNVLVNAIAPGFIDTPMTQKLPEAVKNKALEFIPLKRLGRPEDVAMMVEFLTSGRADYVTGQVIEVTGGM